jgi:hypothetical protein
MLRSAGVVFLELIRNEEFKSQRTDALRDTIFACCRIRAQPKITWFFWLGAKKEKRCSCKMFATVNNI